jgi:2-keto-3-deoxy-L-rhamnonate aldolase RhmA
VIKNKLKQAWFGGRSTINGWLSIGQGSFGPTCANFSAGPNYAAEANDEILAFAMVETSMAMENLDAIAATPDFDGIYVGPADLAFSLAQGRLASAFDREEHEMIEALEKMSPPARRPAKSPPFTAARRTMRRAPSSGAFR